MGIPEVPLRPKSPPNKPPPPVRPALPKSPMASPKHQPVHHTPKVGVISVVPEMINKSKPALPPAPQISNNSVSQLSNEMSSMQMEESNPSENTAIYEEINDEHIVI